MEIPEKVLERARTRWVLDPATGCHVSTYASGSHGYAQLGWWQDGRSVMVLHHRARWIAERGEIPDELTIDHDHSVCQNIRCVNLEHLRLLTRLENAMDGASRKRIYYNRATGERVPVKKKTT